MKPLTLFALILVFSFSIFAKPEPTSKVKTIQNKINHRFNPRMIYSPIDQKPRFDLPMTYNKSVQKWITYYQGRGKNWLKKTFSRTYKYFPSMQYALKQKNMPLDLAYITIIESGLSPKARSHASAVGYWQFIKPTATRYGLKVNWWVDERMDFYRSTEAAVSYLDDLYGMFGSWYLAASAYNMGENKLKRLIKKYKTKNYWILSKQRDFPKETRDYVPKLIATVLIAKAPKLYGFRDIKQLQPHSYDVFHVPGGTDLYNFAQHMGLQPKILQVLNPGILKGFIPRFVKNYRVRIPKGYTPKAVRYLKSQL